MKIGTDISQRTTQTRKDTPMPLLLHQEAMRDMVVNAYRDGRLVFFDTPTASGKTHVFYPIFEEIKKIDPETKYIISTAQTRLAEAVFEEFSRKDGLYAIHLKGTEKQLQTVREDPKRLDNAIRCCLDRITASYGGARSKKELTDKKAEFEQHITGAVNDAGVIAVMDKNDNDGNAAVKRVKENLLDARRSSLRSHYVAAEKILNNALRTIAAGNAAILCENTDGTEKELKKIRKKETDRQYLEQLRCLPKDIEWLFPDIRYELADVIVLTHAKLHRSILTKRRMVLSEIGYQKEGKHIVLVMDEAEVARDSYTDLVIRQAVTSETDLLPLLNRIHNALDGGFFDNPEYRYTGRDGLSFDASVAAQALKERYEAFREKYKYVPNMHMADIVQDESSVPKIVSCGEYSVTRDGKYSYIKTDTDGQAVYLTDEKAEGKGLSSFVSDARGIIRRFIGCCRTATRALNNNRMEAGRFEEPYETAGSVVYRIFGDKDSAMSEYVTDNIRMRFRGKAGQDEEWTLYRSDTSYTRVRPGTQYGGDVSLRHATVPQFPEANMEDIISNIRFTCLVSGTGWLAAGNNYDRAYLGRQYPGCIPSREAMQKIHEGYMQWKEEQYRRAGTEFVIERISDSGRFPDYRDRDLEVISLFIRNHIRHLNTHGVYGSSGAFIFPPRKLDASGPKLISMLREQGTDTDRIALLTLQKGEVKELMPDGRIVTLGGDRVSCDGDTIIIDTGDGRYYYVITAHRSGTRGYNVAFTDEAGGCCDASGLCLHELTNIIPQKEELKAGKEYDPGTEDMNNTERVLRTNMIYAHQMMLRDGKIDPELMAHARWMLQMLSFTGARISKDIYREDPWSPYKLQGTSELLQALGRIRNNRKPPVLYMGLSTGIFLKQMLREETLRPEYLSYEAVRLYEQLPALWREYEKETGAVGEECIVQEARKEAERSRTQKNILKKALPEAKKTAAADPGAIGKLESVVRDYEAAKKQAITLGMRFSTDYNRQNLLTGGLWLSGRDAGGGRKKVRTQDYISPFTYTSYWDEKEKQTVYHMKQQRGKQYLTPHRMLLTETVGMFASFCGEKMNANMPEITDKALLGAMKENDRFPYAPSKYCIDVLCGEYGERLFRSVMQEAAERRMTALTVSPMPILQYEDFDCMLETGDGVAGYVNVKYRDSADYRDLGFPLEKKADLYVEKVLRSPISGTVRLLYINMRPRMNRYECLFTEENNATVRKVNKALAEHGKKIEVFAISPFAESDMYSPEAAAEAIGDTVKKMNVYFR